MIFCMKNTSGVLKGYVLGAVDLNHYLYVGLSMPWA
jgi:hypothetical protein